MLDAKTAGPDAMALEDGKGETIVLRPAHDNAVASGLPIRGRAPVVCPAGALASRG